LAGIIKISSLELLISECRRWNAANRKDTPMNKTLTAIALATAVVASAANAQDGQRFPLCNGGTTTACRLLSTPAEKQMNWCLTGLQGLQPDAMVTCGVKDEDIVYAMDTLVRGFGVSGDGGWVDSHCQPTMTGFRCTYKDITRIYRQTGGTRPAQIGPIPMGR
jgi:hypothetical protein